MLIGAKDDEVFDVLRVELDAAVHGIVKRHRALARRSAGGAEAADPESNGARRAHRFEPGDLFRRQREARAVVLPGLAALLRLLPFRAQPLGRAVAVVGKTV